MANSKLKIEALKGWLIELKAPKKPIERNSINDHNSLVEKFNKKKK